LAEGCNDCLTKPVDTSRLRSLLARYLPAALQLEATSAMYT